MLKIITSSSDTHVAQRIREDFAAAGYPISDGTPVRGDVVLLLVSATAFADKEFMDRLDQALDLSLHIIPVASAPVTLPDLIGHLEVVDLSGGYDFDVLKARVDEAPSPLTMRVLTPMAKRSNRGVGIVLGVIAVFMFVVGLIAVGVFHLQAPVEEYNGIDTMVALTRDIMAAPQLQIYAEFLPRSTEDAANYIPTLLAVPSPYRPLVAMTATAVAQTLATPQPSSSAGN